MTESKHTPGPWQVSGSRHSGDLKIGPDTRLHAVGPDADAVCMVFFDMKTGLGLCDARLIAAAPDLLALLKELIDIEGPQPGTRKWADKVLAAIAKAEGQS